MSTRQGSGRRDFVWAIVGAAVVVAAVIAIIVGSALSGGDDPAGSPTSTNSRAGTDNPDPSQSNGPVVDPDVTAKGWVAEPITTDPAVYIRAALGAASTFDTQKSTRDEWLTYLDSWFTPDTRYASETDREADMQAAKLEMRQGVVLPEDDWNSLAAEAGNVSGMATGEIAFTDVPDDETGDMRIGTADVTLTYTRSDGAGGETSYEETARVSVQVLCGPGLVPTPGTGQEAGDCKVVRYFTEPLEP